MKYEWNLLDLYNDYDCFILKSKQYININNENMNLDDLKELEKMIVYYSLSIYINNTNTNHELIHDLYLKYYKTYQNVYKIKFDEEINYFEKYSSCYKRLLNFKEFSIIEGLKIKDKSDFYNVLFYSNSSESRNDAYKSYNKYVLKENYDCLVNEIIQISNSKDKFEFLDVINHIYNFLKGQKLIQKVISIRKHILNLDEVYISDLSYDLNASISIRFDEVCDCISIALENKYDTTIRNMFINGWIDLYPKKEKSVQNVTIFSDIIHPFVLVNFKEELSSGLALSHEIAHVIASEIQFKDNGYDEVLPICMELKIYKQLAERNCYETDITFLAIERCIMDIFRILLEIKFKDYIYNNNNILKGTQIKEYWINMLKEFHSDQVDLLKEDELIWMNIDLSIPIEDDYKYLLGTCTALLVYLDNLSLSELIIKLKTMSLADLNLYIKENIHKNLLSIDEILIRQGLFNID